MAALGGTNPTLLDIVKSQDPDGTPAKVVEALSERNELLKHMAWKEGNTTTGHQYTSELALPTVGFRRYNEGVAASKGTNEQFTETCTMLSGRCEVDVKLAELGGNSAAFRMSQSRKFLRSFNKELNETFWYGNQGTAPAEFDGLATRLGSTTGTHGSQIILADASASGSDQSSIWLMVFSEDTVYGIHPKGSQAGLSHTDLGKQLVSDGTNDYVAYVDTWDWDVGLVVEDFRYICRIANIDTSTLVPNTATAANLIDSMHESLGVVRDISAGRAVFFASPSVYTMLQRQIAFESQSVFEYVNVPRSGAGGALEGAKVIPTFMGVPVFPDENLLDTEAVVS